MVNTAACIIIGDEVLGGKVRIQSKQLPFGRGKRTDTGGWSRQPTPTRRTWPGSASRWVLT
jgi:hypothetical protein